jgi:hypothetical protein
MHSRPLSKADLEKWLLRNAATPASTSKLITLK